MNTSFKLIKQSEAEDNFIYKLIRWIFYFVAFAFLMWPALILIGVILAIVVGILLLIAAISIVLLPAAIVLRLLRLV